MIARAQAGQKGQLMRQRKQEELERKAAEASTGDPLALAACSIGQSLTLVTFGPGALSACPQNSATNPQNSAKFREHSAKFRNNSVKFRKQSAKIRKNPRNSAKLPQKSAKSKNTKGTTC